jgi:hypothetical protein
MEATAPKVVGPHDGKAGFLRSIGVRFMIDGDEAAVSRSESTRCRHGRWQRRSIGTHARTSTVTYSKVGALLGDAVVIGKPGDLIFKARNQWHTFWNASDEPAVILENHFPRGF